jgi:hypothetical protein
MTNLGNLRGLQERVVVSMSLEHHAVTRACQQMHGLQIFFFILSMRISLIHKLKISEARSGTESLRIFANVVSR